MLEYSCTYNETEKMNKILKIFLSAIFLAITFILIVNFRVLSLSSDKIYDDIKQLPSAEAVLILGARVYGDNRMSSVFLDRVQTALEVYEEGKVGKIIVSGDHGTKYYDEVNVVKDYLLRKGVPGEDIFLDHAGFDTYDSVYRAREIFKVSSLVISTQKFHLSRAVYIAKGLDLEVSGISANRRVYIFSTDYNLRESLARVKAFFNLLFKSESKFLGEPIPISGDGKRSWD